MWLTLYESWLITWYAYAKGEYAPGNHSPGVDVYTASHNMLKAHAAAWHTYDENYRPTQRGKISITLSTGWKEPYDASSATDVAAAERALQFSLGWLAHPIYVNGDYPDVMKFRLAEKSRAQGLNQSKLPEFTDAEKRDIKGTYDFFGLDHFTTRLVREKDWSAHPAGRDTKAAKAPVWDMDMDVEKFLDPTWPGSGTSWEKVVPWGIRKLLVWIKNNYGNPDVYITENGFSDDPDHYGSLQDQTRIDYHRDYINNVLKAITLDGCNVKAYTAWSLMDSFEWRSGYSATYGLHQVDFTDAARPRTAKASADYYKQLIIDNGWPDDSAGNNVITNRWTVIALAVFAAAAAFLLN